MFSKKLLIGLLICGTTLSFTGCIGQEEPKDNISKKPTTLTSTRFVTTSDTYQINGNEYNIVYDIVTDNVYLSAKGGYGNDTFSMLGEDGKPEKYKNLISNSSKN